MAPHQLKVYPSTLLFKMLKCYSGNAKILVIVIKDFKDNFNCGDDDHHHKYPTAVEHELCIVYPEQSLRAPLPCIVGNLHSEPPCIVGTVSPPA